MLSIVPGTAIAQESVWTELTPATSPPGRSVHDMAYDGESDRIVLFGGWGVGFETDLMDDTWAYDFNTNAWTNPNPGTRPSPRGGHAMAYDAESDRVILFGGPDGAETWAYDYNANTWTNMSPVVQPAAWYLAEMAYDAESDRIVLFGGCAGDSFLACPPLTRGETWAYDYNANTWTNMNPGPSPSDRVWHKMAHDAESDRTVLFGGILGTTRLDLLRDTWAYNFNANSWVEMNPEEAPARDDTHEMVYDANTDRIVLYQSWYSPRDTWAYDFDRNTWTRTAISMGPSTRAGPRLAYDTESDRIVLFGGGTGSGFNIVGSDETWVHLLVPSPPDPDPIPPWVYVVIGVVAAAVVAVVAIVLTRRRRRMRKGEGGE